MTDRQYFKRTVDPIRIFVSHRFCLDGKLVDALVNGLNGDKRFQLDRLDTENPQIANPLFTSKQCVAASDIVLVLLPSEVSKQKFTHEGRELSILEIELECAMASKKPMLAFTFEQLITQTAFPPGEAASPSWERLARYTTIASVNTNDLNGRAAAILKALQTHADVLRLHVDYSHELDRIWSECKRSDTNTYTLRMPFRREHNGHNVVRFDDRWTQEGDGHARIHFIVAASGVGKTTYVNNFCIARLHERQNKQSNLQAGERDDSLGCSWFLSHPLVRIDGAQSLSEGDSAVLDTKLDLTWRLAQHVRGSSITGERWRSDAPCLVIDGFNQWNSFDRSRIIDALEPFIRRCNEVQCAVNIIITTRPNTFKAIETEIGSKLLTPSGGYIDPMAMRFDLPDLLFDEEANNEKRQRCREKAYEKYRLSTSYSLPKSGALAPELFRLLLRVPVYFRLIGRKLRDTDQQAVQIAELIAVQTIEEISGSWRTLADQHEQRHGLIGDFLLHVAADLLIRKSQIINRARLREIATSIATGLMAGATATTVRDVVDELMRRVQDSDVLEEIGAPQRSTGDATYRFRYDRVAEAHFAVLLVAPIGAVLARSDGDPALSSGSRILAEAMKLVTARYDAGGASLDSDALWKMDEVHAQGTSLGLAKAIARLAISGAEADSTARLRRLFDFTRPRDRDDAFSDDEYLFCATLFKRAFVIVFAADERSASALCSVLSECIETASPKTRVWAIQLAIDCLQNSSAYYGENSSDERQKSTSRLVKAMRSTLISGDTQVNDQGCIAIATLINDPAYVNACLSNFEYVIGEIRNRNLLSLMVQTLAARWLGAWGTGYLRAGYALGSLRKLLLLLHEFMHSAAGRTGEGRRVRDELLNHLQSILADQARRFESSSTRQLVARRLLDVVFSTMLRANRMPVNLRQWRNICNDAEAGSKFIESCLWVDPDHKLVPDTILARFCEQVPNAFLIENLAFAISCRYFESRTRSRDVEPEVLQMLPALLQQARELCASGSMCRESFVALQYSVSLGLYHANSFAEDLHPMSEATSLNVKLAEEMVKTGGTAYVDSDGRPVTTNIIGTTIRSMLHADESEKAFLHIDSLVGNLPDRHHWCSEDFELATVLITDLALIAVLERGNQRVVNKMFQLGVRALTNHERFSSIVVQSTWVGDRTYESCYTDFCSRLGDAFVRVASFYPRTVDECLADRSGLNVENSVRNLVQHIHKARANAWSREQAGFNEDLSSWLFERLIVNIMTRLVDPQSGALLIPTLVREFTQYLERNRSKVPANALSELGALVIQRTAASLVSRAAQPAA
ncbi:MAG: hypothetical protein JNL19_09575 [Burkholderiales bacterium]|nr:hypothetical protein [Burkholderiales bacterium]